MFRGMDHPEAVHAIDWLARLLSRAELVGGQQQRGGHMQRIHGSQAVPL